MNAHPHHNTPPAADNDTAPLEAVTGTVESIVFRNDETGYTVCSVKTHGGGVRQRDTVVTIVGSCAAVWEGEELHAEGQWIRHPSHGQQFQAKTITCITPTSTEGLRRYLASGMIKGIGPKFAQRIVDRFGERTLDVIDKESGRLREVEGIGEGRRKLIKQQINRFLSSQTPEVISIKGAWGVGKTYAWNTYLVEAKNRKAVEFTNFSASLRLRGFYVFLP